YYIDNVRVWKPSTPPTITKLKRGGPQGAQVTMDQNGAQWQRDGIASPSGAGNVFWSRYTDPVTYSLTLADFPSYISHPGTEAHLYIVNEDTAAPFNETYGACDWNAADILIANLTAVADGYNFSVSWKTNLPGANPLTNAL